MAILRLSCVKERLFAPADLGCFVDRDYDALDGVGRLESVYDDEWLNEQSLLHGHLKRTIAALGAPPARIVVMAHGFMFCPQDPVTENPADSDNAHARIFHDRKFPTAVEQEEHSAGWPFGLGIHEDDGETGVALAFCWDSYPGLAKSLFDPRHNFYQRAYEYATRSAWPFANVLAALAEIAPDQTEIQIMCHSLGSRLVIQALKHLSRYEMDALQRITRVIIMGGAEYVHEARGLMSYLRDNRFGLGPEIFNITCRQDDVLDLLAENFGPHRRRNDQVIGHNGLETSQLSPNWMDLQIDSPELRDWLYEQYSLDVCGDNPSCVADHWMYFTYPGNWKLYQRLLNYGETYGIAALREEGIVEGVVERGWFGD